MGTKVWLVSKQPELENIVIFSKISRKKIRYVWYFQYISSICTYVVLTVSIAMVLLSPLGS